MQYSGISSDLEQKSLQAVFCRLWKVPETAFPEGGPVFSFFSSAGTPVHGGGQAASGSRLQFLQESAEAVFPGGKGFFPSHKMNISRLLPQKDGSRRRAFRREGAGAAIPRPGLPYGNPAPGHGVDCGNIFMLFLFSALCDVGHAGAKKPPFSPALEGPGKWRRVKGETAVRFPTGVSFLKGVRSCALWRRAGICLRTWRGRLRRRQGRPR